MSEARAGRPSPIEAAPGGRLPSRERLLPLLFRRASAAYYRRSDRYALHRARVGAEHVLPEPPLVDVLAVWLAERLPPRTVARIGAAGLFRRAKVIAAVLRLLGRAAVLCFLAARAGWRALRWLRAGLRFAFTLPPDPARFDAHPPVGNARSLLGGVVLFCGFKYAEQRLTCWFKRVRPFFNRCQIFVHLYPADPGVVKRLAGEHGRLSRDHDPHVPVSGWPRRRAYRDELTLADLPPGDYLVEVGLFDMAARQRLVCTENGRSSVDLGWIRIAPSVEAGGAAAAPAQRRAYEKATG